MLDAKLLEALGQPDGDRGPVRLDALREQIERVESKLVALGRRSIRSFPPMRRWPIRSH